MGIKSKMLLNLLHTYPLSEAAQRIKESVPRCKELQSLVLGLDVLAVMGVKCALGPGSTEQAIKAGVNTLIAASTKLTSALKAGVNSFASVALVYVGDGRTPLMKALACYLERGYVSTTPSGRVQNGALEVTGAYMRFLEDALELPEALESVGAHHIEWRLAPYGAEDQLAGLAMRGDVDVVVSTDSDLIGLQTPFYMHVKGDTMTTFSLEAARKKVPVGPFLPIIAGLTSCDYLYVPTEVKDRRDLYERVKLTSEEFGRSVYDSYVALMREGGQDIQSSLSLRVVRNALYTVIKSVVSSADSGDALHMWCDSFAAAVTASIGHYVHPPVLMDDQGGKKVVVPLSHMVAPPGHVIPAEVKEFWADYVDPSDERIRHLVSLGQAARRASALHEASEHPGLSDAHRAAAVKEAIQAQSVVNALVAFVTLPDGLSLEEDYGRRSNRLTALCPRTGVQWDPLTCDMYARAFMNAIRSPSTVSGLIYFPPMKMPNKTLFREGDWVPKIAGKGIKYQDKTGITTLSRRLRHGSPWRMWTKGINLRVIICVHDGLYVMNAFASGGASNRAPKRPSETYFCGTPVILPPKILMAFVKARALTQQSVAEQHWTTISYELLCFVTSFLKQEENKEDFYGITQMWSYWLNPKGDLHPDHIREMERIGAVDDLEALGGRGKAPEADLGQLREASQEGALREGQPTAPIDSTVRAELAEDPDRQYCVRRVGMSSSGIEETVLLLEAVGPLRQQYALADTGAERCCISLGLMEVIRERQADLVLDNFIFAPQTDKIGMGNELTQLRVGFIDLQVTFVEGARPESIEFLVLNSQSTGSKEDQAIFLSHSAIKKYEAAKRSAQFQQPIQQALSYSPANDRCMLQRNVAPPCSCIYCDGRCPEVQNLAMWRSYGQRCLKCAYNCSKNKGSRLDK